MTVFAPEPSPGRPSHTRAASSGVVQENAFFPEKGGSTREAKKVCAACEVRTECLQDALDRGERFGIWGGLSERERRRLHHHLSPVPAAKACPRHALPLSGGPVVFDCPAGHVLYAAELPAGPGQPAAA